MQCNLENQFFKTFYKLTGLITLPLSRSHTVYEKHICKKKKLTRQQIQFNTINTIAWLPVYALLLNRSSQEDTILTVNIESFYQFTPSPSQYDDAVWCKTVFPLH